MFSVLYYNKNFLIVLAASMTGWASLNTHVLQSGVQLSIAIVAFITSIFYAVKLFYDMRLSRTKYNQAKKEEEENTVKIIK